MHANLTILYRGELSSCNYDCSYCPFAKRRDSVAQLELDRQQVERFVDWLANRKQKTAVFFTPWGEALTRGWYREAMRRLSYLPQISKVAVQTNLSCDLNWLADCDPHSLGLWCTYHPSQTSRGAFLDRCYQLKERGISFSVGMVGLPDDLPEIESMRRELPADVYLWVNAWDAGDGKKYAYSQDEQSRLQNVDPFFGSNAVEHSSFGRACVTGQSVISVEGNGDVRRCHFVPQTLGNIYEPDFEDCLQERVCPKQVCGCHIGYVHMPELRQADVFGDGILERVPVAFQWQQPAESRV